MENLEKTKMEKLEKIKMEMIREYEKNKEYYSINFYAFEITCMAFAAGFLSTIDINYDTVFKYVHNEIVKPLYTYQF